MVTGPKMLSRLAKTGLVVVVVVVAVLMLAVITGRADQMVRALTAGDPEPIASADLTDTGPGSLVSAMTIPLLTERITETGARSARVVYRSTEGDTGSPTVVSGTVFVPEGEPPEGGWPVIAYGHGATGVNPECGPSRYDDLLGQDGPVVVLVKQGYAVAYPDYQGLGSPGVHPFTDAKTAGFTMIDAVRALRATFDGVSERWAALGSSQGGGAAWAANEQAQYYAPELEHVGAVALSPAADVSGVVSKAVAGELTLEQAAVLQWLLVSLGRLHPGFDLDDYRSGEVVDDWDSLSQCAVPSSRARSAAVNRMDTDDLMPVSEPAADSLRSLLAAWALPQRPLTAPLFVVYGDEDTYIDASWTTAAIARACALGGLIQWRIEEGKGHLDVNPSDQSSWLAGRFAGDPLESGC